MYIINKENRTIEITNELTKNVTIINEFEALNRIYINGTTDKYRCQLVLLDVVQEDGAIEMEAYAMRMGYPEWLMPFVEEEYNL